MTEVVVVCEGRTEEAFVRGTLAPDLAMRGVLVLPRLVRTSRHAAGGALTPRRVLRFLRDALRERADVYVTTFFDLYGLPADFPGRSRAAASVKSHDRAAVVEGGFHAAVVGEVGCRPDRFLPHLQPYEFESLLFSDTSRFAAVEPAWQRFVGELERARQSAGNAGAHQRRTRDASVRPVGPSASAPLQEGAARYRDIRENRHRSHARGVPALRPVAEASGGPSGRATREADIAILTESVVEDAALDWFRTLGYDVIGGPDMPPGVGALRADYGQVVLASVLRGVVARLNPDLPAEAWDDAVRRLTRPEGSTLEARNRAFHRMAVDGVTVEYRDGGGAVRGAQARVIDFDAPEANDWLAVNQFTVVENRHERRPDLVVFVNGLPLAVIELKNPADEGATIRTAWRQLQTYRAELPSLFAFNAVLAVSDGVQARVGTLTAGWEWFKPWRTVGGERLAPASHAELRVAIEGVFEKARFLALLRDFLVFEDDGSGALVKKMAGYHQFHAVRTAVAETLRAAALRRQARPAAARDERGRYESGRQPGGAAGDRRIGVVWHTQGSGKSLTMAFYAGRIVREPAMENPTVVVLTDRNDLDDQLFTTFSRCAELLRQPPVQAASRADLRAKLAVASGGVVFTTIQKFFPEEASSGSSSRGETPASTGEREGTVPGTAPGTAPETAPGTAPETAPGTAPGTTPYKKRRRKRDRHPLLSNRRNIVVIADEAHRSQYDFVDGYARHMRDALPNASFIGFTGTPIELADAQHPRRVRRPHQRLRHPARGRGRGDGADLLREPSRPAGPRRARAADDRRRLRGSDRGRGGRPPREAEDEVGAARGDRRRGEARGPRRPRHRGALRGSAGGDGRQGDGWSA